MRTTVTLVAVVVVLAGLMAAAAPAAPHAVPKICGQTKGPATAWSDSMPGIGKFKFKGSTWTVFATNASCSFAMKLTPQALRWWPTVKILAHTRVQGWLCLKEKRRGYSGTGVASGSISCTSPDANGSISIDMYAPYTMAQIKQVAAGGAPAGG